MRAAALLVATDLDGSLLDEETYSWDAAREALAALEARDVPLVLCSSKTRAEMEVLAAGLGARRPPVLIVENGGALLVPCGHLSRPIPRALREGRFEIVALGASRPALVAALAEIAEEASVRARGFAGLEPAEIERLTRLPRTAVLLAREREYDEPFLIEGRDGDAAERLAAAARRRGLAVTRGGRFFHLTGATDKGRAIRELLALHRAEGRRFTSVGLGDSVNDLSLLQAVDRPIVIPRPGGALDAELAGALPRAERAPEPGPRGWNAAVLALLDGRGLPAVAAAASKGAPER